MTISIILHRLPATAAVPQDSPTKSYWAIRVPDRAAFVSGTGSYLSPGKATETTF